MVKSNHLLSTWKDELKFVDRQELRASAVFFLVVLHLVPQEGLVASHVVVINVIADDEADGTTEVLEQDAVTRTVGSIAVDFAVFGLTDEIVAICAGGEVDVNSKLMVKDGSETFHIRDSIFKTEPGADV